MSNVVFSRNMKEIIGSSEDIRTVIFPEMVRTVRLGAFHKDKKLASAILNEGLKTLGMNEYEKDGRPGRGAFENCGIQKIRLPSTLTRIEYSTFFDCANLKNIQLPSKLEFIGRLCFFRSGLEDIVFPQSVKTVDA